jgi:hypothetical protein
MAGTCTHPSEGETALHEARPQLVVGMRILTSADVTYSEPRYALLASQPHRGPLLPSSTRPSVRQGGTGKTPCVVKQRGWTRVF